MSERNVLVVFHEPRAGGAVISVLRMLPELEQRGWRFCFWVPRPSPLFDSLAADGRDVDGAPRHIDHSIRALRLPPGPRRRISSVPPYLRKFRAFLRTRRPALVHANSVLTLSEALVAAATPARVLLHVHEMVPGGLRGWLTRRAAWSRLDAVVAVSSACAATMGLGGRSPRIVHEAAPAPEQAVPVRQRERFTIGTVGVISPRKGSDLFVEAARAASERDERLRFEIIAGGIDERARGWCERVIASARESGIEYRPQARVEARLREWDAFALPSRQDPFPISMLEAMAAGLPVIGAAVDGIREQIAPGSGLLVPPDDPAALAEAMLALARMPLAERAAMARAARARVLARFTIEHQAAAMNEVYEDLLEPASRP